MKGEPAGVFGLQQPTLGPGLGKSKNASLPDNKRQHEICPLISFNSSPAGTKKDLKRVSLVGAPAGQPITFER